ncbi:unnamed protein product [Ectocarpus sp. CCAP 1310/34]|nr:unnamed protein product [Ectocarpus sp. CCAP 1310/34]
MMLCKRSVCTSSRRLVGMHILIVAGLLGQTGAFMAPTGKPTAERGLERGVKAIGAAGTEAASSKSTSTGSTDASSKTLLLRDQLRDAIWKATDSITHAVEGMPDVMANTNESLLKLGTLVENIDERYFSKYVAVGATPAYKDTLAAAATTTSGATGTGVSMSKGGKPDKMTEEAEGLASTASSDASKAADAVSKSVSASAGAAVETVGKAAGDAKAAVAEEGSSGTVKLDRPKEVQGVFDDVQKKAVDFYKTSSGAMSKSQDAEGGAVAPMSEAAKTLETKLESLLSESNFKPRKLKKDKKSQLVDAIKAMEESYPAGANPLADPALSGQWSVVYSSSSRLLGRVIKGLFSGFFKTSDRRQVVDTGASSVLNACRARLRLTPLALRVAKKGSYRKTAERKVLVEMPPTKKGLLRRVLPSLRAGKVEAEVTYLSDKWRICRAGGVTLAFRKSGGED